MENRIDYLKLNYPIELIRDTERGGFFAAHPDLPGCAAQGETPEQAIANLDDARNLWIETRLEDGLPVPLPLSEEPSGRVLLRMSRSLHSELAKHAARQDVSLNLLINTVLAEYIGGAAYRAELSGFMETGKRLESMVSTWAPAKHIGEWWFISDDPELPLRSLIASNFSWQDLAIHGWSRQVTRFKKAPKLFITSEEAEDERDY